MNAETVALLKALRKVFANVYPVSPLFHEDEHLWYPLDKEEIRSRLKGEHDTADLYSFFRLSRDQEMLNFTKEYENILGNPSLNPHKPYPPLKFGYWVEPKEVISFLDSQIFGFLDTDFTHIFYVGEKGCGKTLTLNCWLHSRNSRLEEEKVFWVRSDGYKLYKLWYHHEADCEHLTSLKDYLDIQLVYVFAKHYMTSSFFREIFETLRKEKTTFERIPGRSWSYREDAEVAKYLEEFSEHIRGYENARRAIDPKVSYARYILQEAQSRRTGIDRARWNLSSLSERLQDFLLENGYRILKIVDGIDNVNLLNDQALPYYLRLVKEVAQFMYTSRTPQILKLVSLRERTLIDVKRTRLALPDKLRDDIHPLEVFHKSPSFISISKRRWRYVKDLSENPQTRIKIPSLFHQYPLFQVTSSGLHDVNKCYHNNVSTFLYNHLALLMMIYYRWLQLGKVKEFSVDNYIQIFRSRVLFLNDRFYLHSKEYVPDVPRIKKGQFSFNIFFSQPNQKARKLSRRWQGLCTTRIVQVLSSVDSEREITEEQIIKYLNKQFGYAIGEIKRNLELCKNFGLIDTKMSDKRETVYLTVSRKGKYVIKLVFSDLDVLYTLALDTFLPKPYAGLLSVHSNKLNEDTQYANSSITATILFLLFVTYIHSEEMNLFSQKIEDEFWHLSRKDFALPLNVASITKRALRLYNLVKPEEKRHIREFILMLEQREKRRTRM